MVSIRSGAEENKRHYFRFRDFNQSDHLLRPEMNVIHSGLLEIIRFGRVRKFPSQKCTQTEKDGRY